MYKFDLKSGYHPIDICQGHLQVLSFQWPLGGPSYRYFCFTVSPFGLSSAPCLFTNILLPLVRHWRGAGIHLVLYLDDGAGCEEGFIITQSCSEIVQIISLSPYVGNVSLIMSSFCSLLTLFEMPGILPLIWAVSNLPTVLWRSRFVAQQL